MAGPAQAHILTGQDFLAKAEEALAQDDLLQASEKGWGAAAHTVKGVAEGKGWLHNGHRELYQAVNRLAHEVGDSEIRVLFSVANPVCEYFRRVTSPIVRVDFLEPGLSGQQWYG